MQLIVKMLASMRKENGNEEETEDSIYQSPRAAYDDYMEEYLNVVSELNMIHFIIREIYGYYSSDMIRVLFFYG